MNSMHYRKFWIQDLLHGISFIDQEKEPVSTSTVKALK